MRLAATASSARAARGSSAGATAATPAARPANSLRLAGSAAGGVGWGWKRRKARRGGRAGTGARGSRAASAPPIRALSGRGALSCPPMAGQERARRLGARATRRRGPWPRARATRHPGRPHHRSSPGPRRTRTCAWRAPAGLRRREGKGRRRWGAHPRGSVRRDHGLPLLRTGQAAGHAGGVHGGRGGDGGPGVRSATARRRPLCPPVGAPFVRAPPPCIAAALATLDRPAGAGGEERRPRRRPVAWLPAVGRGGASPSPALERADWIHAPRLRRRRRAPRAPPPTPVAPPSHSLRQTVDASVAAVFGDSGDAPPRATSAPPHLEQLWAAQQPVRRRRGARVACVPSPPPHSPRSRSSGAECALRAGARAGARPRRLQPLPPLFRHFPLPPTPPTAAGRPPWAATFDATKTMKNSTRCRRQRGGACRRRCSVGTAEALRPCSPTTSPLLPAPLLTGTIRLMTTAARPVMACCGRWAALLSPTPRPAWAASPGRTRPRATPRSTCRMGWGGWPCRRGSTRGRLPPRRGRRRRRRRRRRQTA